MNNKAFTLIELLVVVLIIGILTAIAVPQYQKAVLKSRFAQAKTLVESVVRAQETYFLANGQYAANFSDLDITLPEPEHPKSSSSFYFYDWGFCYLNGQVQASCANPKIEYQVEYNGKYRKCISYNEISEKICQQETNDSNPYNSGSHKLWRYK